MLRFTVEERHLTDNDGRPIATLEADAVSFLTLDAETIDEAIGIYTQTHQAEVMGNVLKFPGFQAVVTIRKATGVYTLQLTPASQSFRV